MAGTRPVLGHRPALTGLRGIAVSMVVMQHLRIGPVHDARGVDLFFVLSGFLITVILLQEISARGRLNFRRFYLRRLLRLFPALFAMVAVTTVVFLLWGPPDWHERTAYGAVVSLTYLTNLARGVWRSPVEPFEHTWSLALEEQFYLFWPLVLTALVRLTRGRPARLLWSIAAVAAIDLVIGIAYYQSTADFPHLYVNLDGRGVQLLVGCLLGAAFHHGLLEQIPERVRTSVLPVLASVALAGFVAIMWFHPFGSSADDRSALSVLDLPVCGIGAAALLLGLLLAPESRLGRAASWRPIVWLGLVSYPLYLWHSPVIWFVDQSALPAWVRVPLVVAVSLAFASASWYLLERPIARRRDLLIGARPPSPRPVARPARTSG